MNPTEVFDIYSQHINPKFVAVLRLAGLDVVEDHALGSEVWDSEGKRYLDFLGLYGAMSFGHRHPKIIQAVKDQLDKMPMPAKVMMNEKVALLAQKLCQKSGLDYVFFCNSGAEAVEGAIKIARAASGKTKIISAKNGYHGKTLGALALTAQPHYQDPFRPLIGDVDHVPYGDIQALEQMIDDQTAAVILEPIQGEGGIILPPVGYFQAVRKLTEERGVILIADEVQTGLGRTGYWLGIEHEGVQPDMVVLAKALGGGVMPVGAFLAKAELWKPFESDPKIHSTTFGSNALAAAAGLAALEVLEEENLCEKSQENGQYLLSELQKIWSKHPLLIKDVRGRGLMIGVEFSEADIGTLFIGEMSMRGVLTAFGLNDQRVIRLEPPLNISKEHLDEGIKAFAESVQAVEDQLIEYGLLESLSNA